MCLFPVMGIFDTVFVIISSIVLSPLEFNEGVNQGPICVFYDEILAVISMITYYF